MMSLLAGVTFGLASSAHCAAMCGPLVTSIGRRVGTASARAQLGHVLLYHCGRAAIYVLLALPAGAAGETLVVRGLGRGLAICAGVLLLAAAAGSTRVRPFGNMSAGYSRLLARLSTRLLRWAAAHTVAGPLATGALNGLLPCGLVYAALTAAVATGTVAGAALLMAGFGAGTSAILVALALGAASIPQKARARLGAATPLVLAAAAMILIARGATAPHHHHPAAPPAQHVHE